jgi:hypothetical protein
MTTTVREFQNELNKLDDPAYTKGPLIASLKQMAGGAKIGDFAARIFAVKEDETVVEEEAYESDLHQRLSACKTIDELKVQLKKLVDDTSFSFKKHFKDPHQCYSFAKDGPNARTIEEMTLSQKNLAEMLLASYANRDELNKREAS